MPSILFIAECGRHGSTKHRFSKREGTSCTKCEIEYLDNYRRSRKTKLIDLAGGSCRKCGYNKCQDALEFHHRIPEDKLFELSLRGMTKAWDMILKEYDKCDLLCRNCHAEEHQEMNSRSRSQIKGRLAER